MKRTRFSLVTLRVLAFAGLVLLCNRPAYADELRVAVASNFSDAIKEIAQAFEKKTDHQITLAFGSTGKHYAQIKNGAPFHAFFAADVERPKLLEEEGVAQPDSRFTYAVGKVLLWSPTEDLVDARGEVLNSGRFRYLALANPKLAPYGNAAEQVLQAKGAWETLQNRMVRGENIGQTYQFVISGNAELGFVALSQVKKPGATITGSYWAPPQSFYDPIEQQAVLLKNNVVARDFLSFVRSEPVRKIIQNYGYGTPE
ncbi:MAG: molybdate ABC transporter substrate-binding protein [SAR324 cluster bacterium]|nr:molybdate ABC transporter substrate-binding protein [SAR324 cluster bacterium]